MNEVTERIRRMLRDANISEQATRNHLASLETQISVNREVLTHKGNFTRELEHLLNLAEETDKAEEEEAS